LEKIMKFGVAVGSGPIRVLVADSNQTQSQLLAAALRRQPTFNVSTCNAELTACRLAVESSCAEVLLIGDGGDDHENQRELVRTLHRSYPKMAIILLLDSYDHELVVSALRGGARGLFCRASQPFKALCKCIWAVHAGQFWANTEQMGYVIEALVHSPGINVTNERGDSLLTRREGQVVTLVAEGLGNRAIAKQLKITENTVKKSLLRIFDKLGISNRVELVLYALARREAEASRACAEIACPNPSRLLQCRLESVRHRQQLVSVKVDTSIPIVNAVPEA
jgi:DNA-binding NarL/FixJ family response regulator